MRTSDF